MSLKNPSAIRRLQRKATRGFTLIEILVVIVVIAILASVIAPDVLRNVEDARWNTAKSQIGTLVTALDNYRLDNGRYPSTEQGLAALNELPTNDPPPNWRGPYLRGVLPVDPWGKPYLYFAPGDVNPGAFDLYSFGADGLPGGEKNDADVVSWN